MHNDMSDSLKLAITLMVLGFTLSIVMALVTVGQSANRGFQGEINTLTATMISNDLEALSEYRGDLPAASVYVALSGDPGLIENISGTAYGVTITKIEDLKQLFKRQIHVTIYKHLDTYRIVISA